MVRYLIAGNSAAGTAAAQAIRRVDGEGDILILSEEPYPAYSRPRLTEFLAGSCSQEDLSFRSPDFYQRRRLQVRYGKAVRLDLERREVELEDGSRVSWEKLLIATGGTAALPQEFSGLEGVFAFKSLDDALRILAALKAGKGVAVIGAGLIGVSAAKALAKRGVPVTLIARSPRILSTFLDSGAAALAEEALTRNGVRVMTNSGGERLVRRGKQRRVGRVALGTGEEVPADLVIVGRGVNPRTELVRGTAIRVDQGILVDQSLATSFPGVYACGDAAQVPDAVDGVPRLNGNWPNAIMGGRAAGTNMAGGKATFSAVGFNSLNLFGLPVMAAGIAEPPSQDGYQVHLRQEPGSYRKLVLHQGRLVGMVLVGDIRRAGILLNLLRKGIPVAEFQEELLREDFGLLSLPEEVRRQELQLARRQG